MKKLTKTQADLLRAIQNGVKVFYMSWSRSSGHYYFRADTMNRCTKAAEALGHSGLIEMKDRTVEITDLGRDLLALEAGIAGAGGSKP